MGTGDVDVLELADNTAWRVLAWPELVGFLEPGQAYWMVEHEELGIEGKLPVDPSAASCPSARRRLRGLSRAG